MDIIEFHIISKASAIFNEAMDVSPYDFSALFQIWVTNLTAVCEKHTTYRGVIRSVRDLCESQTRLTSLALCWLQKATQLLGNWNVASWIHCLKFEKLVQPFNDPLIHCHQEAERLLLESEAQFLSSSADILLDLMLYLWWVIEDFGKSIDPEVDFS